jgi:hypothetical protein
MHLWDTWFLYYKNWRNLMSLWHVVNLLSQEWSCSPTCRKTRRETSWRDAVLTRRINKTANAIPPLIGSLNQSFKTNKAISRTSTIVDCSTRNKVRIRLRQTSRTKSGKNSKGVPSNPKSITHFKILPEI